MPVKIHEMGETFSAWYERFAKDMGKYGAPIENEAQYEKQAVFERLKLKGFKFLPEDEEQNEFGPIIP
jgi:hypothetical protein